jgi:hypothetical protein
MYNGRRGRKQPAEWVVVALTCFGDLRNMPEMQAHAPPYCEKYHEDSRSSQRPCPNDE